jgi:hypothetical protein
VNAGILSNEQVLIATQVHETKWTSVLKELREDTKDADARFQFVFLLDDFTASGQTLLRLEKEDLRWAGKLVRFWDEVKPHLATHFAEGWGLGVHHYVGSHGAARRVEESDRRLRNARPESWFPSVEFTFGMTLPSTTVLDPGRDAAFLALADAHYDPSIETRHTAVGGGTVVRGFGECALPLVLEHNTPNNSMALLWAESSGAGGRHPMRPLFRRRQRHV